MLGTMLVVNQRMQRIWDGWLLHLCYEQACSHTAAPIEKYQIHIFKFNPCNEQIYLP